MSYTTLISPADLAMHLDDPRWAIVDCRFSLDRPERGRDDYRRAHIPSAVYAHLDQDLAAPIVPGETGRHPLPSVEAAAQTFGRFGIDVGTQVVAYDDAGGAIAARLWWMLRWLGHDKVAVLDGGWPRWIDEGHSTRGGDETRPATVFVPHPRPELVVDAADVLRATHDPQARVIDSRSADRYRGENETIDPIAGHIPGAISGPYAENLDSNSQFLPPAELAARFRDLIGDVEPEQALFYCGSGVTAAHNLLALAHAGLGEGRLYAGSWSDWITDPGRPVEKG